MRCLDSITDSMDMGLGRLGYPCSPRNSQASSPTPQFKSINSSALGPLYYLTLTSIHRFPTCSQLPHALHPHVEIRSFLTLLGLCIRSPSESARRDLRIPILQKRKRRVREVALSGVLWLIRAYTEWSPDTSTGLSLPGPAASGPWQH